MDYRNLRPPDVDSDITVEEHDTDRTFHVYHAPTRTLVVIPAHEVMRRTFGQMLHQHPMGREWVIKALVAETLARYKRGELPRQW